MSKIAGAYSLAARLQWVVAFVLLVSLGLTGIVLDQAFRQSADAAVAERLQLHVYSLLAAAEMEQGGLKLPEQLEIPRLDQLESGLYAQVRDAAGQVIWRSLSSRTVERDWPIEIPERGARTFIRLEEGYPEPMFVANYGVAWDLSGNLVDYTLTVMESMLPYRQQIYRFRAYLWGWLSTVGLLLLVAQGVILRWVLRPLRRMAADLTAIQEGKRESLDANYPTELARLTGSLNDLLQSERRQRERYRNNVGDLAHSLKTPLAVLRGLADERALGLQSEVLKQQVDRLNEMVSYQLQRAVIAGRKSMAKPVAVLPVAEKLRQTLDKVYAEKQIKAELKIQRDEVFYGDEHDLYEVLGNLMENAYKYTHRWMCLSVDNNQLHHNKQLRIVMEDDGPGVPEHRRVSVLARGVRLDSRDIGQGIGLAVVADIVEGYDGKIEIEASPVGGARFVVII
ncbi:MAG: ATP-binding protein [Pseudomonadales bacterium]